MEGPRAAKKEELKQIVGIINSVFRTNAGLAPTMGEEFPLLLCEDNLDNIRIMVEDGRPVSVVNYYKSTILIGGNSINAASVGAVCTHPDYRGRSLATILLDDVEKKVLHEGIDVLLVSGDLSIYKKRNCVTAGNYYTATLLSCNAKNESCELVEYDESMFDTMVRLFSRENVRFYRSFHEFEGFFKGGTVPVGNSTFKTYLVRDGMEYTAYIILNITNGEAATGVVKEYAGRRESVLKGLESIMARHSLGSLSVHIPLEDEIINLCNMGNIEVKRFNQNQTLKLMNFVSFMNKLKSYFTQFVGPEIMSTIDFETEDSKYIFRINNETVEISDFTFLMHLIFSRMDNGKIEKLTSGKPLLKRFFNTVFPVPFPSMACLNFI